MVVGLKMVLEDVLEPLDRSAAVVARNGVIDTVSFVRACE
jgi:hypothetical protein